MPTLGDATVVVVGLTGILMFLVPVKTNFLTLHTYKCAYLGALLISENIYRFYTHVREKRRFPAVHPLNPDSHLLSNGNVRK